MRDNSEGLPRFVDAFERDNHYFCVISLTLEGVTKLFEFGIDLKSYRAIKRMFNLRPFETLPGIKYEYYFVPSVRKANQRTYCKVRIQLGERGKEFEVEAPENLIANLIWFFDVKQLQELDHLREINSTKEG